MKKRPSIWKILGVTLLVLIGVLWPVALLKLGILPKNYLTLLLYVVYILVMMKIGHHFDKRRTV